MNLIYSNFAFIKNYNYNYGNNYDISIEIMQNKNYVYKYDYNYYKDYRKHAEHFQKGPKIQSLTKAYETLNVQVHTGKLKR